MQNQSKGLYQHLIFHAVILCDVRCVNILFWIKKIVYIYKGTEANKNLQFNLKETILSLPTRMTIVITALPNYMY
jgi:hypothetical protein